MTSEEEEGQVCRERAHFQPGDARYSNCTPNSAGPMAETVQAPPPPTLPAQPGSAQLQHGARPGGQRLVPPPITGQIQTQKLFKKFVFTIRRGTLENALF